MIYIDKEAYSMTLVTLVKEIVPCPGPQLKVHGNLTHYLFVPYLQIHMSIEQIME